MTEMSTFSCINGHTGLSVSVLKSLKMTETCTCSETNELCYHTCLCMCMDKAHRNVTSLLVFHILFFFHSFSVRQLDNKIINFWEHLAPRMMPRTYHWYFCMREDCVNGLTRFLNPQIRIHPGGREQTDHKKMVAMTLYWMGNESAYKHIATTFGVTEDTFI